MNFTLNRNLVHASLMGGAIEFKKGVPTHVPPRMHKEVIGLGAQPAEEIEEPESTQTQVPEGSEREELIKLAMQDVVVGNVREEFTAAGAPHAKVLSARVGFTVSPHERDAIWAELKAGSAE